MAESKLEQMRRAVANKPAPTPKPADPARLGGPHKIDCICARCEESRGKATEAVKAIVKAAKPKKQHKTPRYRDGEMRTKGRYPAGTKVEAIYYNPVDDQGESQDIWLGQASLSGVFCFEGQSTGLHQLMTELWQQYLAWRKAQEVPCPPKD